MENSLWRTLEAPVPRFRDPCDRRRLPPRSDGCGSRAGAYAGGPDRVRPDRSFLRDGRLPGATRPRDWRVLVPIETECLLLLAAIIASNLIFALGGDRCIAASVNMLALAATDICFRFLALWSFVFERASRMLQYRSMIWLFANHF